MIVAFYDLAVSPVSFDMLHFLTAASRAAGNDHLHVVILPGPNNGFKAKDHKPISDAEKRWRVEHILIPLCAAIGATSTLAPSREFGYALAGNNLTFPLDYRAVKSMAKHYRMGRAIEAIRDGFYPRFAASERAHEHVAKWLKWRNKVVTITLRNTHTTLRNSSQAAWWKFAHALEDRGYHPIVIPDTERMTDRAAESEDFCFFPLAACDLDIRMALYDRAVMNMASSGGPFMLNVYDSTRKYLYFFKLFQDHEQWQGVPPEWHPTHEFMERFGFPEGSQFTDDPKRRIVWGDDDYATLIEAFDRAMAA